MKGHGISVSPKVHEILYCGFPSCMSWNQEIALDNWLEMHKTSVYLIVIEWRAKLKKLPDLHKLITILTRSFCKTKSKRVQVPPASAIYIILLEYDPKIYSRFSFQWPQLRVDYCLYVEQTFILSIAVLLLCVNSFMV